MCLAVEWFLSLSHSCCWGRPHKLIHFIHFSGFLAGLGNWWNCVFPSLSGYLLSVLQATYVHLFTIFQLTADVSWVHLTCLLSDCFVCRIKWRIATSACVRARVFQNLVSFLVRHHFKATLCNSNAPKRPSFGQNLRQNHSNQFQWCAKYCKLQVQWLKKNIQDDNKCKINMCTSGHPVLQRHQASSSWVRRTGNWGHALIIWCICPGFFDSGSAEAAHKVSDQRYWVSSYKIQNHTMSFNVFLVYLL